MLLNTCKDNGLAVITRKTTYIEVGHHQGMMANENLTVGSNSDEDLYIFTLFIEKLNFYSQGNKM